MAPFPPSCTAVLPMSAQDYFMERDSASFRALMSEVESQPSGLVVPVFITRTVVCWPPIPFRFRDLFAGRSLIGLWASVTHAGLQRAASRSTQLSKP